MDSKIERLKNLSDNKLIDVVKNYRQYGYSEEIRGEAINLLRERGVSKEDLKLSGQFENKNYTDAEYCYQNYMRYSTIAIVSYFILILFVILSFFIGYSSIYFATIAAVVYFASFYISLVNYKLFYELLNKPNSSSDILIVTVVGFSLYIYFYFHFKSKMKEELQMIG